MRSLLSAHSRVAITPETHFLIEAVGAGGIGAEAPADFEEFWKKHVETTRFIDLGVDPDRCRALIDETGDYSYRTVFSAMLDAYAEKVGKVRVGEKTPGHVHHIPELLGWFPQARIIVLRRDPRAVIASLLQTPWVRRNIRSSSLRTGILTGSRRYQVARFADDWAKMYEGPVKAYRKDPRVHIVSYEDLVRDVESELQKICAFIGETYEPAMVTQRKGVPPPAGTERIPSAEWRQWRVEHNEKSLRPVSDESLEKWKDQLNSAEVALIEGRCFAQMVLSGYELVSPEGRRVFRHMQVNAIIRMELAEARARLFAGRSLQRLRRALG